MTKNQKNYKNDAALPVIKVVGIDSAARKAVNCLPEFGIKHVKYIAMDYEKQQSVGFIKKTIAGTDLLFIISEVDGQNCATTQLFTRMARETIPEAIIIVIFTKPGEYANKACIDKAQTCLNELGKHVDCLFNVPHAYAFSVVASKINGRSAYKPYPGAIAKIIQTISSSLTTGPINVDYYDVKKILNKSGRGLIGIGRASGASRHLTATKTAMATLMEKSTEISAAKGVLVRIASSSEIKMFEIKESMDYVIKAVNPKAFIRHAQIFEEGLGDDFRISVIATAFIPKGPDSDSRGGSKGLPFAHDKRARGTSVEFNKIAATAFAVMFNTLDPMVFIPLLGESVVYSSQSVLADLKGKPAVAKYLTGKIKTIKKGLPGTKVFAELAEYQNSPCVLLAQGRKEPPLVLVLFTISEKIVMRVQYCTVAPNPMQASRLSVYPETLSD